MSSHIATVTEWVAPGHGTTHWYEYRAVCTCGWEGTAHTKYSVAFNDADKHMRDNERPIGGPDDLEGNPKEAS